MCTLTLPELRKANEALNCASPCWELSIAANLYQEWSPGTLAVSKVTTMSPNRRSPPIPVSTSLPPSVYRTYRLRT